MDMRTQQRLTRQVKGRQLVSLLLDMTVISFAYQEPLRDQLPPRQYSTTAFEETDRTTDKEVDIKRLQAAAINSLSVNEKVRWGITKVPILMTLLDTQNQKNKSGFEGNSRVKTVVFIAMLDWLDSPTELSLAYQQS